MRRVVCRRENRVLPMGGTARFPTIAHLDADAFFVSVEQALNPALRGTKCAVGGRERGIISSASYEARACGVYTPMPTVRALKVCPDLILIPHSSGNYGRVSRQMFDLCETLTPLVQRNSIDEGYLDLGPCGHRTEESLVAAVRGLQARIWTDLQIPVSLGLAANKLVAQIASKLRKPRGFVIVPPGTEADFLAPLPVGKLPGVGVKTEEVFKARGVNLVSDLFRLSEEELGVLAGNGWRGLLAAARGEDERPVETEEDDAKSYSQQETFGTDVSDFGQVERVAKGMLDELMAKVRADGKRVRTITVKVRYPDFAHASHSCSLAEASDLEAPFVAPLAECLRAAWKLRRPLRLVSVKLSSVEDGGGQLDLFPGDDEKRRRLAAAVDALNRGTGSRAVVHGHQLAKRRRPD